MLLVLLALQAFTVLASPSASCLQGLACTRGVTSGVRSDARSRRLLTREELQFAIREAFGSDSSDLKVQIVDFSKTPVPAGKLVFLSSGATPPSISRPDNPFLWRGKMISEAGSEIACWVRVTVLTRRRLVQTKTALVAGTILQAGDLETVQTVACPLLTPLDEDPGSYLGFALKRSLRASTVLTRQMVEPAPLVRRGSRVQVEAISGTAHISFEAEAHANGRAGQSIELSNLHTGRLFWGTVNGKGSVSVRVNR
jgi:flagella basal body P-ring formation protein FlgA